MNNVIDFSAARERANQPEQTHPIQEALDSLALALCDHAHEWTDRERQLYETAVSYITSSGYKGSD
tara:strand:+ start:596 stop:793 length:198 start_codon:yes stop_codon:yes gene_type:complete